jgi:hypothetical protein
MQNNGIKFNPYEMEILQDRVFLPAKRAVIEKVEDMLSEFQALLATHEQYQAKAEEKFGIEFQSSKISRGENYRGLPYVVLDYPRYFKQEDVFGFRTMLWWGNFYSFTLQVQGSLLQKIVLDPARMNWEEETFIGAGASPWEYHYEKDNYRLLNAKETVSIGEMPFLKLSRKIPVTSSSEEVMETGLRAYKDFIKGVLLG